MNVNLEDFDQTFSEAETVNPLPDARSLIDLAAVLPDPAKTLLGNRFLCIGGGMLFVGPSGIGKSSASVQQDISWALGHAAFGINPARPLRILCVQAENDDGDLGEMSRGVCAGLHLSAEDRETVRDRVLYVSERASTGAGFLAMLARLLKKHPSDILRIDPLLAYLGADVNDAEATAAFLRTGLNPLLDEFNCGAIINHHTPKVTNRDTSAWRASDWMYAGAGSADLTNWCRAALVIDPTHAGHVFRFIAAKRGGRIGWRNDADEPIYDRFFCHETNGGLCWREATPADVEAVTAATTSKKSGRNVKPPAELKALVPAIDSMRKDALLNAARGQGFTARGAAGALADLLENGDLFEHRVKRKGTNPEVRISRHEQTLAEVSQ